MNGRKGLVFRSCCGAELSMMSRRCFVVVFAALVSTESFPAEPKLVPRHDPPDQLFRRAPMAESARSIVVNLSTNLHAAFDAELCRVHTIWRGGPLNLWGPPYSGAKSKFICDFGGEVLYKAPRMSPWFYFGREVSPNFAGIRVETNEVWFEYELQLGEQRVAVREKIEGSIAGTNWTARRTFVFANGVPDNIRFLAGTYQLLEETPNFQSSFRPSIDTVTKEYFVRDRITEESTERILPMERNSGEERRFFIEVPARETAFTFDIVMFPGADPLNRTTTAVRNDERKVFGAGSDRRRDSGDEFFRIEHFPVPPEAEMIVTGMDWVNERDLAVCTWMGEIFIVENATGKVGEARYRRFARGLNEPLGLKVHAGKMFVVQKGELTEVSDTDGDGEADYFRCVSDDWGYSGNYHSYSFGPLVTGADELMLFVTGQRGRADLMYQGWAIRVKEGEVEPFCYGLRVPHGWGIYQGDIFVTDNQGNWIGTCRLNHLEAGKFYGFPSSKPARKRVYSAEEVAPPVLWLPRVLSPSASGIETITADAFGPFKGQMLIGDFQNSIVIRAFLERVNGMWQGAVFPFAMGFLSGVNRLSFGRDGKLYVGGGKRTWSTAAPKEYSLDRVSFTGKVPFEVSEVRALKDGFELRFTKPVEGEVAKDPENYLVKQFGYKYHEEYGSPEFDHDGKVGATEIEVTGTEVAEDGKVVRLKMKGLRTGFVTSFQLAVNSAEDEDLRHDTFYYTLNEVPDNLLEVR
ncbi:MAG TPA: hypothetical protein VF773_18810 [Verrucomicrobiae bacterium]